MSICDADWIKEEERLDYVLVQIGKQLEDKMDYVRKIKKDSSDLRKSMWDEIGAFGDLESMAQYMQYTDTIKMEAITLEFYNTMVHKLKRMLISPYFGRIDFLEEGENHAKKFYIGISTLIDGQNEEYLVYDWRAPVSSMFYDYETGRADYKCPECIVEGELLLKRQYRISNSKIHYMFDSNIKIDDEILQELLSKNADSKMKTIITSIQREQNKIIRDDAHNLLIVQGPAGSGKTSIALHRIAYLLYRYRDSLNSENIVIFSPNRIFSDYISDVLPELGEKNMYQTTFMEYAHKSLGDMAWLEDMNGQMEYLLIERNSPEYHSRVKSIIYKTSFGFANILKCYITYLENEGITFDDVFYKDSLIISKEDISSLFHKDYSFIKILKRLEKIKNRIFYLLEQYETERIGQVMEELDGTGEFLHKGEIKVRSIYIVQNEFKPLKDKIEKMTTLDIKEAYKRLFTNSGLLMKISVDELPDGYNDISHLTNRYLDNNTMLYEDIAPVLFLQGELGILPDTTQIRHVVIDEAQDYTVLQFKTFRQLFPGSSLTILGDLNQSINYYMNINKYENILEIFDAGNKAFLSLSKSYRSTKEISAFTRAILINGDSSGYMDRPGEKPVVIKASSEHILFVGLKQQINSLKADGFKSIAIICKTACESLGVYGSLAEIPGISLITKDDAEYTKGVVIIPSYLSKGLEFDCVLIFHAGEDAYSHEDERGLFYTACTRALHRLYIYYTGSLSHFIAGIDVDLYTHVQ